MMRNTMKKMVPTPASMRMEVASFPHTSGSLSEGGFQFSSSFLTRRARSSGRNGFLM